MSKLPTSQKYILKIHTARLRKAKWNLTLPLSEARKNNEVIELNDAQTLDWIDELNDIKDADITAKNIRLTIKMLKKQADSLQNRREIKRCYEQLDNVLYKPDYIFLVIDEKKDYHRACRGFSINNIKYVRLVGTNGGVKNKTIVFVSERLSTELRRRIDNDRDTTVPFIPAKFEAYRALPCSSSSPVSLPRGILVVNDCETEFQENIISLSDAVGDEPVMEYVSNEKIVLTESDGYGLILPSLAKRWSEELGLDYVISGANTRFSWEKGMVFCFDFLEFADKVAHKYIVKDAWGNDIDIRNVELILTTSMLKLWNAYKSIDHYLECCIKNHYSFRIAKVCPKELESERNLNYQFIQSYDLTDDQVEELIRPTINHIKDILAGDYRKAVLFLKGEHLNYDNIDYIANDFAKAIMIDKRVYNDVFIKHKIYQMIRNRINEAKIGVISVHGNYSIVSGDPYSLCQSIFGLPVTGLLKKGEIYNRYWVDRNTDKVVCFRAPMTCHNNIRLMNVANNPEVNHWYQYMTTCTLFNSWDSSAQALNGMDKDGDLVLTTDNKVLINNYKAEPTIMCIQRKGEKIISTEEDLILSNINSFGDEIGKITNRITAMFDVRAGYQPGSIEYETLTYRIICGQLYQQNAIDKAKGIIAKPMPKWWYDRNANAITDEMNDEEIDIREFNLSILADRKPYFMRYIYPDLMSEYNTYTKNTNKKCIREFKVTIEELLLKPEEERTESENDFIYYYQYHMPVSTNDCVLNRICKRFEEEFDSYFPKNFPESNFDYSFMRSGKRYSALQYNAVAKLYDQHNKRLQEYKQLSSKERIDEYDARLQRAIMTETFKRDCEYVCSDSAQLCDIILDLCYKKGTSKLFAWDVCGDSIIENLLAHNGNIIYFPVLDENGDIEFNGNKFTMCQKESC